MYLRYTSQTLLTHSQIINSHNYKTKQLKIWNSSRLFNALYMQQKKVFKNVFINFIYWCHISDKVNPDLPKLKN